jgi:hypothetical protein
MKLNYKDTVKDKGKTMQRRFFIAGAVGAGWAAGLPAQAVAAMLSEGDASLGVRTALTRGADAAVGLLGQPDGFLGNPKVRIPLPGFLADAAKTLRLIGQQKRVDELVDAMNRAAEKAVPEAKGLLLDAVNKMSLDDALKIVRGGDTSVTQFFAEKTRAPLQVKFLPIVTEATQQVSLAEKYNAVAGKAMSFGLVKKEDANIEQYVTRKALDGLYFVIGEQERSIRRDPFGTGSAILKKVFGA